MTHQSFSERFQLTGPVWPHFGELTKIPRPSKHEGKAREYVQKVAAAFGRPWRRDTVGNIVVAVPPKPGYEHARTVVVQSHLDIVPAKREGSTHDFLTDPITVVRKGDWLHAEDTTLGADNGIGDAASLALIGDADAVHGPLELLFTVDEEEGLSGALQFDPNLITGSLLLNLDTEKEGVIYIGCAGGRDTVGCIPANESATMPTPEGMRAFSITIDGLRGGHSGDEIHLSLGNALKILGGILRRACHHHGAFVASFSGGDKGSAIPRFARATLLFHASDAMHLVSKLHEWVNEERGIAISHPEDRLDARIVEVAVPERVWYPRRTIDVITLLDALPHGALLWHPEMEGLVETSTNLAILTGSSTGEIVIRTSQRSSRPSSLYEIAQYVAKIFAKADVQAVHEHDYPSWQPNFKSPLLKETRATYERLFGKPPSVKAIHAGLECGVLGQKKPGLDMVSFGPTILGAHTPDERVHIASVDTFYRLLVGLLADLARR